VYIPRSCIYACVTLYTEVPLVPFLRLAYLQIPASNIEPYYYNGKSPNGNRKDVMIYLL
jgi:hypothetical protein